MEIRGESDRCFGWLLGFPIDSEGHLITGEVRVRPNDGLTPQALEEWLYAFGGRFAAILLTDELQRLYLDCAGSLSVVYRTDQRVAGSTGSLLATPQDTDHALVEALSMPESGKFYPSGLTPHAPVRRLLPNHYLDLSSWETVRHWPTTEGFRPVRNPDDCTAEIAETIKRQLSAVCATYPALLSLTAGRDSRLLLACARDVLDRVHFFTFSFKASSVDTSVALRLARRFGLEHSLIRVEQGSPGQYESFLFRTGHAVSGPIAEMAPALRQLDHSRALLPAMAGEVARLPAGTRSSYYRRYSSERQESISASSILSCLRLPVVGDLLRSTEDWLEGISNLPEHVILDLTYIEQRLGCWAGPQQYGSDIYTTCQLWPIAHRDVFALMIGLPLEYKLRKGLTDDICRRYWPELLTFPYNEPVGLRRHSRRAIKALGKRTARLRQWIRA